VERVSAQQLAEWAAEARERWSVPGLAVGLLHHGETVVPADGVCELGSDERVRPETAFSDRVVAVTFFDPLSGENIAYPPFLARPVDEREFEVVGADRRGERLTFPRDGLVCIGVLGARTE
jgi:hypothetical protein